MKSEEGKSEKLLNEYLDFISSKEEARNFLIEEGLDPDELVNEGMRRAKLIQMQIASQKTEKEYAHIKSNLLQKAKDHVAKILNDTAFNLEAFITQENINLAFKNFEKMTPDETKEFLERHFLLKLENEEKNKKK